MAGSTSKKVLIRRFEREPLAGFVNPQTCFEAGGVEILTTAGNLLVAPYDEIKVLYFVRDLDAVEPPAESRLFQNRPKMNGVWIRMKFRDGDRMDGIMPNNLLQLEAFGFSFVPPSGQKVFVPKAALAEIQIVGVVGSPLRRRKAAPQPQRQIGLFD